MIAAATPLVDAVHLSVHADFASVEPIWRAFEQRAVRSIYQRFDWIAPWLHHAGKAQGVAPAVVVGTLRGETVFILPLGRWRHGLVRIVGWLGGSHVNINAGLFDADFLRLLSSGEVPGLVQRIAAALKPVDYLDLSNQPASWQGLANPFAHLPKTIAAQPVLAMRLEPDFDAVVGRGNGARRRKKLRWQENTLAPAGGYRFRRAGSPAEARVILDKFLNQKAEQFKRAGMRNVFAVAGVPAFLADMAARAGERSDGLISFYALDIAGVTRATFAAGVDRGRVFGYFSSISQDEFTRVSPGDLLLTNLIRESCERGFAELDLGVGEERYKTSWATEPEPHFSVFVPVTALGRLAVSSVAHWKALEYRVRSSHSLWEAVKRMRRATSTTVPPAAAED